MGDRSLVRELKRWATEEFNLPAHSLPNDSYFKTLCVGPGASIWKYVTHHVFHQRNVRIIRGNLQWYKVLEDKKLKGEAGQSEAAKRRELQEEIQELRAEIKHLDSQISGTEAQLATEEWSADALVGEYPPSQLLSSLQSLTSDQQVALEGKMASLDVVQEVTALRFRYQDKHLLDMSIEEEKELPPVKSLIQSAWKDVEHSLVELAQTRSRTQSLQDQLQNSTLSLGCLEVELQTLIQSVVRDQVKQQCLLMEQQTRGKQEGLRMLRIQRQKILDFRQLVDSRQEQIRALIKGNSTAKTELLSLHTELGDFHQTKVAPEFTEVITAASGLRNSVSQEARQFGTVSLAALDRRTIDRVQRVPASGLSIHRLSSSSLSFSSLCESLDFPLYRAPESLCSLAVERHLELCLLKGLLLLHSSSLEDTQRQQGRLQAPDLQGLMSRVQEEDQVLLETLLPRVNSLSQRCTQGLSIGGQVQTAISDWWEQPAQHALPEARQSGLTFQQWLQRWRLAARTT
ncbi:HAUS augmin-like complex subunit 5 [Aplochiton taeniatus]